MDQGQRPQIEKVSGKLRGIINMSIDKERGSIVSNDRGILAPAHPVPSLSYLQPTEITEQSKTESRTNLYLPAAADINTHEKPQTLEEFKKKIDAYVKETRLGDFFPLSNPFIQTVAEKATNLLADPLDPLSRPGNLKDLVKVSLYQSVIYCGKSSHLRYQNELIQA